MLLMCICGSIPSYWGAASFGSSLVLRKRANGAENPQSITGRMLDSEGGPELYSDFAYEWVKHWVTHGTQLTVKNFRVVCHTAVNRK